jgi:hypothetical protein
MNDSTWIMILGQVIVLPLCFWFGFMIGKIK